MAFLNSDPLTTSWALITSEATFTSQNRSSGYAEVLFNATPPAPSDLGVLIEPLSGVDSSMGSGSLYARLPEEGNEVILVVIY